MSQLFESENNYNFAPKSFAYLLPMMILIDMAFSFEVCQNERNIDADCFACVVSTHGSEEIEKRKGEGSAKQVYQHCVYGSDGSPVFINDILEEVQDDTSPYLAGKPKLFFIQVMFKPY